MKTSIFIIGSGVVGAATGEGFLRAGHDVTFVEMRTFENLAEAEFIKCAHNIFNATKLAAIVNHEVDTATHAAAEQLRDAARTARTARTVERPEHEAA